MSIDVVLTTDMVLYETKTRFLSRCPKTVVVFIVPLNVRLDFSL